MKPVKQKYSLSQDEETVGEIRGPVSYTHLDVYKRQAGGWLWHQPARALYLCRTGL